LVHTGSHGETLHDAFTITHLKGKTNLSFVQLYILFKKNPAFKGIWEIPQNVLTGTRKENWCVKILVIPWLSLASECLFEKL